VTAYSLYGHLFMTRLKYNQASVNIISIAAELAMYLPVPAFGYLCDRNGPRPPSLLAGGFFGAGYLMAAFAYRSGPPVELGGNGWPFWTMVVAFVLIGMGTSCMYLAAVSTCAKNFGRGNSKGIALACPIAAFGLSGMWVSQVGSRVLCERSPIDGSCGDVDVFKFFIFLGAILFVAGLLGGVSLSVVDEGEMIEQAIDQLEQSGILSETEFNSFFRRAAAEHGYGTFSQADLSQSTVNFLVEEAEQLKQKEAEEKARKNWLLNSETRRFLADRTMWWLAAGFFLITGPGEAFINNVGTIIGTLYPPDAQVPTNAATHVSIIALMSTFSRLLTGTLTDLLAPATLPHQHHLNGRSLSSSMASLPPKRFSLSRLWFLISFALLLSMGQILLASGVMDRRGESFWIVSALIGAGYGAVFSLTPIVISVVWGVENFATNWGIVATVPAGGAAVWGMVYSAVYQWAAERGHGNVGLPEDGNAELCFGKECYEGTFWAMAVCVWIACGLWIFAWRGPGGWRERGVAV
jgi:MFS family permease